MVAKIERKCDNCTYCILLDEGYSNYTVENTLVYCMLDVLPDPGFDRGWGGRDQQPKLFYAEQCPHFEAGNPVQLDVDRDTELTPEEFTRMELTNSFERVGWEPSRRRNRRG